ncbi:hypothetical protein [Nonomuraea sp. CA-141351]|uniref:hypothetical protein n=1 Tax=Nonomuraea sp. CA-141351 TaxID=3239996 RepID=UPI003D90083C
MSLEPALVAGVLGVTLVMSMATAAGAAAAEKGRYFGTAVAANCNGNTFGFTVQHNGNYNRPAASCRVG